MNYNKAFDLSYLIQSSGNNIEFIKNMIQIFLRQTPEFLLIIKKSMDKNDWKSLKAVVHKMKPTLVMMGIPLGKQIQDTELLLKNDTVDATKMQILIMEIIATLETAILELKTEVNQLST